MFWGEIRTSKELRLFGIVLCLTNILSVLHWGPLDAFARHALTDVPSVCWPYFETCATYRPWIIAHLNTLLITLTLLSILAALAFARSRVRAACSLSIVALGLKLLLIAQDYRFSGNFHYMTQAMWVVFLFVPQKKNTLLALLATFYFAAGLLKFQPEWWNGLALIRPTILTGHWLKVACAYVVLLETILIFGLFSRGRLFWLTLAQLILFHVFSWHIVGYFYPITMLLLLSWPVLYQRTGERFSWRQMQKPVLALFAICQFVPLLYPGNPAVSGEGRIFSESMLDSFTQCRLFALYRNPRNIEDHSEDFRRLGVRIGCDPLVIWNYSRELCQHRPSADTQLQVVFFSKRRSDEHYTRVINESDFCSAAPHYDLLRHNSWIRNEAAPEGPVVELNPSQRPMDVKVGPGGRVYGLGSQGHPLWTAAIGDDVEKDFCKGPHGSIVLNVRNLDVYGQTWHSTQVALDPQNGHPMLVEARCE